jgi:hypothetical protein
MVSLKNQTADKWLQIVSSKKPSTLTVAKLNIPVKILPDVAGQLG